MWHCLDRGSKSLHVAHHVLFVTAIITNNILDRGCSVSLSPRGNAAEQSHSRFYGSVACTVNMLCCIKPLRFGDCLFPGYNLIYPDWYRHLGNRGQREGPRVPKRYLTNYLSLPNLVPPPECFATTTFLFFVSCFLKK